MPLLAVSPATYSSTEIVHRDAVCAVIEAAADIAGKVERGAVGAELGDKSIDAAVVCKVRTAGNREGGLSGVCFPGDISATETIHCDAVCAVIESAADIAGKFEGVAVGAELGDKSIDAAVVCKVRTAGNREGGLSGVCFPGDISATETIHCDRVRAIIEVPPI